MQASLNVAFDSDLGYLPEKEVMKERIDSQGDSAAAVVGKIFEEQNSDFLKEILGVVALLGTVQTNELGRILAEYLGEEQLLAVVCRSSKAASDLEKYDKNGNVNQACGLIALATECGKSLNGRYNVICLEDIRPYMGEVDNDPQRKLLLQDPTLQNGKRPPGFLGYAVNMIYIDVHHLHTRTAAGKGLRETLFYRLFGELQVYGTREYMREAQANSCIENAAVSLDGGIMRGNGLISLGCCAPYIHFPVVTPRSRSHSSPRSMHILKMIAAVERHK